MNAQLIEDILTLVALAEVVAEVDTEDDDEVGPWCRGIGTTPAELLEIARRCQLATRE